MVILNSFKWLFCFKSRSIYRKWTFYEPSKLVREWVQATHGSCLLWNVNNVSTRLLVISYCKVNTGVNMRVNFAARRAHPTASYGERFKSLNWVFRSNMQVVHPWKGMRALYIDFVYGHFFSVQYIEFRSCLSWGLNTGFD